MKKFFPFLIFLLFFFSPLKIHAKTINDLYQELYYLIEQKDVYSLKNNMTIEQIIKEKETLEQELLQLTENLNQIKNSSEEKENQILNLKQELNHIILFYQLQNKKNLYLEYLFNANNYSEFLYRKMSITQIINYQQETISNYQQELIALVKEKEKYQKKLDELSQKRDNYADLEIFLKSKKISITDSISTTLEEDIQNIQKEIRDYQAIGCKKDQELEVCLNITTMQTFTYPLQKGCVSKEYNISSHKGIDLACNKERTNVYASGRGVVGETLWKTPCGGNIVFIYHNVNGKKYTTIYGHLLKIKVSPGQAVDENTVIGLVGGETTALKNGGYDRCTTGAHLHYAITEEYHTYDFSSYTVNPRVMNHYPVSFSEFFTR